jgi:hypothetical protein
MAAFEILLVKVFKDKQSYKCMTRAGQKSGEGACAKPVHRQIADFSSMILSKVAL